MVTDTKGRLGDLIPGYPPDAPQTLAELYTLGQREIDQLDLEADGRNMVRGLYDQLDGFAPVELSSGLSLTMPITSPSIVELLLTTSDATKRLQAYPRRWTTYAIDSAKRLQLDPRQKGGLESRRVLTPLVPDLDQLPEIPTDGGVLLLYGGGPEKVMHTKDAAARLRELATQIYVLDVMFWEEPDDDPKTLYSAAAGCGVQAGVRVDFPNVADLGFREAGR